MTMTGALERSGGHDYVLERLAHHRGIAPDEMTSSPSQSIAESFSKLP